MEKQVRKKPSRGNELRVTSTHFDSDVSDACLQDSDNSSDGFSTEDYEVDDNGLISLTKSSSLNPQNWPFKERIQYTVLYAVTTFLAQLNSTTMSSDYFISDMSYLYNIGHECSMLATTLYVLGIAIGPMVFAPISEMYGRKMGVLVPLFISGVFSLVTSVSYNVPSIMVTRFLSGLFAGAPIVSSGGVMSDLWTAQARGGALAFYACLVSAGALLGPTIGSILIHSNSSAQGWRIPQWLCGLAELAWFLISFGVVKETYRPVVESKLARKLRLSERSWKLHSKHDTWTFSLTELIHVHFFRPFAMLLTPIVFLMALYASYVFGLFYLMITNVPVAFNLCYGWTGTVATLPNIPFFIGVLVGNGVNMFWSKKYGDYIDKHDGKALPEERLPIMMITQWLMPIGIFIFGWSSWKSIHWIVPCIGVAFMGTGYITIFQGCLNYLVDCFPHYAASAIAANTFLRSIFAATFPLFAKQLFTNLGVHWGASVIGFISIGMLPIPFYFFKNGARIRIKNPYNLG